MPAGRKVPPRSLLTMRGGTPTPTLESATQKFNERAFQLPRCGLHGSWPDFVQMRLRAGYDLVRHMPEARRLGDTR